VATLSRRRLTAADSDSSGRRKQPVDPSVILCRDRQYNRFDTELRPQKQLAEDAL